VAQLLYAQRIAKGQPCDFPAEGFWEKVEVWIP
jgi:hypothetical protein